MLHYPRNPELKVFWLLPRKDFPDGIRLIVSEEDTLVMASVVHKVKTLVLYFDHEAITSGSDWDDVVANPVASLPRVISPSKGQTRQRNNEAADDEGPEDAHDSSSDDSDFDDSDYDLEDDEYLFVDNVDEHVTDEGVAKGRKIAKGTKRATGRTSTGTSVVAHDDDENEESTDDDRLELPQSDGECEPAFKFKSFKPEDMAHPVFKVGMMFDTVEMLRKAITEYSLRNRVDIKMPRNEQKRLQANCSEGCPWFLYASYDKRANGMMIKTYTGKHSCQKKWVLKSCTSTWLAEKYIETFRADQKMSLSNFSRTVQKEWNLTPSRTKLARARRLAMKKVLGDEEEQYNMLWDYAHELRKTNPYSTFYLNLDGNIFKSLYVSLGACKRGFLGGCKPLICLDGCHLKTKYGGIMLTAVGIDPNDCIFPIAFGVVEVECLDSWRWFLTTLKQDLGIENTYPWTLMTDKQKVRNLPFIVVQVMLNL